MTFTPVARCLAVALSLSYLTSPLISVAAGFEHSACKMNTLCTHVATLTGPFRRLIPSLSSGEINTQGLFSESNVFDVCRRCCLRCRLKPFTFSSFSPEPLSQFLLNLAKGSLLFGITYELSKRRR